MADRDPTKTERMISGLYYSDRNREVPKHLREWVHKELEIQENVLRYVREHPGVDVQEVIRNRATGSRKSVEEAIKHLLYKKPKRLRSEHPEGTHAFGRGMAKTMGDRRGQQRRVGQ